MHHQPIALLLASGWLLWSLHLAAPPRSEAARPISVGAARVLLLDSSGRTLYAKAPDETHAPASLVKMMTLYVALGDIAAGRARSDEPVVVSRQAAATPPHRLGLRPGEVVPLGELLSAVGVASANDAATAVAEHLSGGDVEAFVARMNDEAETLGLTDTRFANPHGLPDPTQRSTARDLARLTVRLMQDHPQARTYLGAQSFLYQGRPYTRSIPLFRDPGDVEALKTGFTREAGYNLAVTAWRAGRQFVVVMLGAASRSASYAEARRALHHGFVVAGLETERRAPARAARPARTAERIAQRLR